MKTDEHRHERIHRPQAQQADAEVERVRRFDDDLMQGVVFVAVWC